MKLRLDEALKILDEQAIVSFTGKICILNDLTKQQVGDILFDDGNIVSCSYLAHQGLKAFYSLFIAIFDEKEIQFIVEPEVIAGYERTLYYPYAVLKKKLKPLLERYKMAQKSKPAKHLKILLNASFLAEGEEVTANEYEAMLTISDYSKVEDIYKNSTLLDFEMTDALVSLRQKKALKVVKENKAR